MATARTGRWTFAGVVLVALPAVIHAMLAGTYMIDLDGDRRTFAIGPIGTTIPYLCLALVFLAHSASPRVRTRAAYATALIAWLSMMAFTGFLVSHPPGPENSSTEAIAVVLTPLLYGLLLVTAYGVGVLVTVAYNRLREMGAMRAS